MPIIRKILVAFILGVSIAILAGAGWVWQVTGAYGFNSIWRRGGTYWTSMKPDDERLSPSMRLALTRPAPIAQPGPMTWQQPEPGFEVAELPVLVDGHEVDRIMLGRVDPTRFRFVTRNAPSGDVGIDEWERLLPKAVLIVNGSYYDKRGKPDTPFISEGATMGPQQYDAKAGAFVATADAADVHDLTHEDWRNAFAGATNAMVSYPLLIGDDGQTHVNAKSRWLANRTFVARDGAGKIVIGTTKEAFFSLDRLAEFLKQSPLDLKIALNLDGGPIACRSVRLNGYQQKFYAKWEAQVDNDTVELLRWPISQANWAMPMVLTVERR
ncbi:phosphodiester glycosidase family protein [Rhizobium sp. BK491]|uniref:phosphodiester glycosidase family protein n=1 Tax=Rhizobium sp. BK491 TaxID=2587009 RepID=UPI00161449E8|nr:phosphodiester glycosidase family protein [Rhizobium sp. BK491]